jgi:hypothetical protein
MRVRLIIIIIIIVVIMVRSLDRLVLHVLNIQRMKSRRPLLLPPGIGLARRHQLAHKQK